MSCEYCQDYHSTYEGVIEAHYTQCTKYPVSCPYKCRKESFQRQKLESHKRNECPMALIDCPFSCTGCETNLLRNDMPQHLSSTAVYTSHCWQISHKDLCRSCNLPQMEVAHLKDETSKLKLAL